MPLLMSHNDFFTKVVTLSNTPTGFSPSAFLFLNAAVSKIKGVNPRRPFKFFIIFITPVLC